MHRKHSTQTHSEASRSPPPPPPPPPSPPPPHTHTLFRTAYELSPTLFCLKSVKSTYCAPFDPFSPVVTAIFGWKRRAGGLQRPQNPSSDPLPTAASRFPPMAHPHFISQIDALAVRWHFITPPPPPPCVYSRGIPGWHRHYRSAPPSRLEAD